MCPFSIVSKYIDRNYKGVGDTPPAENSSGHHRTLSEVTGTTGLCKAPAISTLEFSHFYPHPLEQHSQYTYTNLPSTAGVKKTCKPGDNRLGNGATAL